ncbi:Alcohol acetyltransferase [Gnomoniopsis smithogilvyi]|uniref:Alcohol acetyltransferase n=1 Tax=Gnomoniopsis smithogilvyi TaxID=1191159 RepID=A0A9W8YZ11_9PEZI|nr:Alcohol acetyltransferase [Gnomoniopsis smithogilvyi]
MSAVYSNLTSTHDLKPLIFGAVARVIDRHPALSTVFMEANEGCKDPYYAQLSHIDLQDCTVFETWKWEDEESAAADEQRDKLLERYHNTRFDERWGELPLWRLVILQEPSDQSRFVACFVWQHTIGDGHTGPSFHHSFQAELSALSVNPVGVKDLENIVRPPKAAIPPSLESLHKLPLSPLYLLKMAWQDKFPNKSQAVWLGGPVTEPTRSRFRSFSLTTDTTSSLLAVCRAHSVTMTAVIHALIALATFSNLPPNKTRLKSSIAINLRRWISSDALKEDDMGNYVSTTYLDSKRPESMEGISWGEALRIKKLLDNEVKLGGKNASTGCLRWVDDMHKYFASKTGQPRDATFCLTNLGVFHPKNKDDANPPWSTEKMVFSEGFDAAREAMDVTMITGEDGRLTLGLIWGDGVVEEKLMLDIFDKLKNLVVATASQP